MKPAYYPEASSDEGATMQFDLVCTVETRSMIDLRSERMAASGPLLPYDLARMSVLRDA